MVGLLMEQSRLRRVQKPSQSSGMSSEMDFLSDDLIKERVWLLLDILEDKVG
jgi:hypothetical protein